MKPSLTFCIFCAALACAATPILAADQPGTLFPKVKPTFVASESASPAEITAPLASPAETADAEKSVRPLINEATKGTKEDRAAAIELLVQRASAADKSGGKRRLLLLAAFNLSKDSSLTNEETAALVETLLDSLDTPTLATYTQQTIVLMDIFARTNGKSLVFSAARAANAFYRLAELQFNVAQYAAAEKSLALGEDWAKRDAAYDILTQKTVARFRAQLLEATAVDRLLAEKPDDPEANLKKGLKLLVRSADASAAAPYLAKSGKKEFQTFAAALTNKTIGLDPRLNVAAAALDCLPLAQDEALVALCLLARDQLQFVSADRKATDTQRTKAELLNAKLERAMRKLQESDKLAETQPRASQASFFQVKINATRIVYILDHSGSMLDNFDYLRQEVKKSTNALDSDQSFNVVMVSETATVLAEKGKTMPATPELKKEIIDKLYKEFRAQGRNDDLLLPFQNAFEEAFKMKPDLIFFLTDGHFDPKLSDIVKKLNQAQKVKINTLAFVNRGAEYEAQLQSLAKNNGGTYKFVSEKDLPQ